MAVLVPWTHEVWASWRPQLCFYDHRLQILKAFDHVDALIRFTVPDNAIEAEVVGVGFIRLTPGNFRMMVASPRFEEESVADAVDLLLGPFDSTTCRLRVHAQQIIPIEDDYDVARQNAIAGWMHAPITKGMTDVAILADGVDADTGFKYQCEFGIINELEAVDRINRLVGRAGSRDQPPLEPDIENLPPTSSFFDWHWRHEVQEPIPLVTSVQDFRTACIAATDRRSAILHSRGLATANRLEAL